MVSSPVPRLEERCPPVWLTDSRTKVRSSSARRRNPGRSSLRSAAGSLMVFSSSYAPGSYSADPAADPLPGRSACPIALMSAHYPSIHQNFRSTMKSASSERLRAPEPEHRDVGRLVVRRVLAGGLAERRRRGLLVEHVVDHLESEPHAFRVVVEARQLS